MRTILKDLALYLLLILAFVYSSVRHDVAYTDAGAASKFVYQQF